MLFIIFVQTLLSISHNIRQRLIVQYYILGKYENMLEAADEFFMHQFNYFCQLIFRGICITEHHQTKYTKVKIITLETKTTGSTNSIFPPFTKSVRSANFAPPQFVYRFVNKAQYDIIAQCQFVLCRWCWIHFGMNIIMWALRCSRHMNLERIKGCESFDMNRSYVRANGTLKYYCYCFNEY